jgi:predicted ATPase
MCMCPILLGEVLSIGGSTFAFLQLAAAQLRLLTPATLLRRLGTGLDRSLDLAASAVDTPDRQRTLRATIQWSYSLLTEAERALLTRLSVFTGSWTVEASDAVGAVAADLDAVDTLASLLAQSLILIDESDPPSRASGC